MARHLVFALVFFCIAVSLLGHRQKSDPFKSCKEEQSQEKQDTCNSLVSLATSGAGL